MTWTASAFRHSRKREKDGKYQIKIKLRNTTTKFQRDFPIEQTVNGKREKLSLSDQEWKNQSRVITKVIKYSEGRYVEIARSLEIKGKPLSTDDILFYYRQNILDFNDQLTVERMKDALSYDCDPEVIEYFKDEELLEIAKNLEESDLMTEDGELSIEDVGSVLLNVEIRNNRKKTLEKVKSIKDNLDRCDAQYQLPEFFDKSRIIDVFGFFWTLRKINGSRYLNLWYQKIVLRLAQYIFISGASNELKDFDEKWLNSYFIYLRDVGYLDTREIRNYTPLELYDYQDVIKNKADQCKPYELDSFRDQIKKFKRYFQILMDETDLLDQLPKINLKKFNVDSLKLSNSNFEESFTQKDHYVNLTELMQMSNFKSEKEELIKTRDLFFIQTFTSGNRSIEKDKVKFISEKGVTYFEVKHSKTRSKVKTGKFQFLNQVIERNGGALPKISIKVSDYNANLKVIAKELNLNREIEFISNKMNSKQTLYQYISLYECISQYFSRHTLVNYLIDAEEFTNEEIISLTGHADVKILDHYRKKVSVEDKQKLIDKADKKNLG
jgi:hypothetical protein